MVEKTPCSDIEFKVRLVDPADYLKLADFSCGQPELDEFFHSEVEECVNHHYLAAYIATSMSEEIIAVFTLMNDALMIEGHMAKAEFIDDLRVGNTDSIVDFF